MSAASTHYSLKEIRNIEFIHHGSHQFSKDCLYPQNNFHLGDYLLDQSKSFDGVKILNFYDLTAS